MKKILLSLCLLLSFIYSTESNISKYLKKDIKQRNPFADYRELEGILGAPLPLMSVEKSKAVYESPFVERKKEVGSSKKLQVDTLSVSNYIFNAGLSKLSPVVSNNVDDFFARYTSIVDFDLSLNSNISNEVQTIGGNAIMYITLYESNIAKFLFFGALNRDASTRLWSTYYGVENRLKFGNTLHKVFFREKLTDDNNRDTIYYGYEFVPFKHFTTYVQGERNNINDKINTYKIGARYKIRF